MPMESKLILSLKIDKTTVLAKYAGHAGHVRQTSPDVRQRAPTLLDILSGRVQCMENVQQERKELPVIN